MARPPIVLLLSALASMTLGACKDEQASGTGSTPTVVEVQPTDQLRCGFGVTPAAGPWDEITLQADGTIKWTHVGAAATASPEENFAMTGSLDAGATKAWMQEMVDLGVPTRTRAELPKDATRTECVGSLGGLKVDFQHEGLPAPELRGKLDALTARCVSGD